MKEMDREESGTGMKEKKTEAIKTFPLYPNYLQQGQQALSNCKPISVGRPGEVRNTTLRYTQICINNLDLVIWLADN